MNCNKPEGASCPNVPSFHLVVVKDTYCITSAVLLVHNLAVIMISMHNRDKYHTISLINIFFFHA